MPRIWGTRRLDSLFTDEREFAERIGEAWLTGRECRLADGPFAGGTLGDAWRKMGAEWRGWRLQEHEEFPLLVKFIFPAEKLSIQVHPDDDYARRHEGGAAGAGKTEMWYAVAAEPGAEVLLGPRPDVTRESFRQAIAEGTAETCLERVAVVPGDAIYVPAGTVHTIGPGLVLCEVQEYSELTYRIFDYNRLTAEGHPRPLHIEKALAVIRFGEGRAGKLPPVRIVRGGVAKSYFLACRYFAVEKWEFSERLFGASSGERFELLIFVAGRGAFDWRWQSKPYAPGQAWLLPAALGSYALEPKTATTLLRSYIPELDGFDEALAREGVEEGTRARLLFR